MRATSLLKMATLWRIQVDHFRRPRVQAHASPARLRRAATLSRHRPDVKFRVGIPIADLCAGIFAAQGILVALLERETSGKGQWLHTSLPEWMTDDLARMKSTGVF